MVNTVTSSVAKQHLGDIMCKNVTEDFLLRKYGSLEMAFRYYRTILIRDDKFLSMGRFIGILEKDMRGKKYGHR